MVMKVLIVEDNAIIAVMLEDDVRSCGYEVIGICSRSSDALDILSKSSCDCVLVDVDLADGRTGHVVARDAARQGCFVIFISGQGEFARQHRQDALGLLLKPVSESTLHHCLRAVEAMMQGEEPDWPREFECFQLGEVRRAQSLY
jgi:two-component SAPR family response regulator